VIDDNLNVSPSLTYNSPDPSARKNKEMDEVELVDDELNHSFDNEPDDR